MICVFALFYGDHPELAIRLTHSLEALLAVPNAVGEFRFGMNAVSQATERYLYEWAERQSQVVRLYRPERNVGKYPLMRRMFRVPAVDFFDVKEISAPTNATNSTLGIWFDDDAYIKQPVAAAKWWQDWQTAISRADLTGQIMYWFLQRGQKQWMESCDWYRHGIPWEVFKGKQAIRFAQGSCWSFRLDYLLKLDWPIPELHHTGGDSLLGLRVLHEGGQIAKFEQNICTNCDAAGNSNKSKRRGMNPRPIGYDFPNTPVTTPCQDFTCTVTTFNERRL